MAKNRRSYAVRRTISQRSELVYDIHEYGLNLDTREVWLHGYLTDMGWEDTMVDYRMANIFLKNLRLLETVGTGPILIHQCTCGGEWSYGMAIYDAIAACRSRVTILCHAHARSMSSIIPQAADVRVIMPNADFMIHYGDGGVEGFVPQVISEVDWWKKLNDRMLDIYVEVVRGSTRFYRWSQKRIREFLDGRMRSTPNWYLTSGEAVEYGFMDAVLGSDGYRDVRSLLK